MQPSGECVKNESVAPCLVSEVHHLAPNTAPDTTLGFTAIVLPADLALTDQGQGTFPPRVLCRLPKDTVGAPQDPQKEA